MCSSRHSSIVGTTRLLRYLSVAAAAGIIGLIPLAIVSLLVSDFVPSALTVCCAKVLGIAFGIFYGVFFFGFKGFGWDATNPIIAAGIPTGSAIAKRYVRVPLMALVYFGFAWLSFSSALPWMLNSIIGTENSRTVVVDGWLDASWSFRGGTQCARPTVTGIPFGMLGRRALCVPKSEKTKLKPGASIVLYGRTSAWGISPVRYRLVEP